MRRFRFFLLLAYLTVPFGCGYESEEGEDNSAELQEILKEKSEFEKEFLPEAKTGELPSMREEDILKRGEFYRDLLEKLEGSSPEQLNFSDRITWDLLKYVLENNVATIDFKSYLNPLLVDAGFHIGFAFKPDNLSFTTLENYNNYINMLKAYPAYNRQHIMLLKKGIEEGLIQPKVIFEGYVETASKHVVKKPENSIFYKPFQNFPVTFSDDTIENLRIRGGEAIMEDIVPAYKSFAEFLEEEYIPSAREDIGASELPNGDAYYRQRIEYFTTLPLSADSIHQLGLREVNRIRTDMEETIGRTGFEGTFDEFLSFLRSDERFYAQTPEELLTHVAYITKRMDGKLPSLFGKMPRQPYTVEPVPDHIAPKYTSGRYVGAPLDGTQPGRYWVNTYDLDSRPLYVMEALSFHEAVPGHHLQNALSKELEGLPEFRNQLYISAYGEGWGLYSEWLGKEAGFYQDPYSEFGRLTYEMWRACRLVVDTGIHAFGWTRGQAMDYMREHTALSLHEIRTEVDRYISWPGQALAYKIGEIKIRQLRKLAVEELGSSFDVREFHDMVLSQGAVTLPVLERLIKSWIEENKQAS